MTIQAVLFDFGQTLVDSADGFRSAEKEAQRKIAADLGLGDLEALLPDYRRLRRAFQAASDFSRLSLWQTVYAQHGRRADPVLLARWEDEYWRRVREKTAPFPETGRVLGALGRRLRLGLVTNTQGQTSPAEHRLHELPALAEHFEVIVVAGEHGLPAKPDPTPFLHCLDRLGVPAQSAVYVGDDWDCDVLGARGAGLHAIWLKHRRVPRRWPDVQPDVPVITSLEPLLDLENLLGIEDLANARGGRDSG